MGKLVWGLFILICVISCNQNEQGDIGATQQEKAKQARMQPPKVTVIAELPDSLQPKVYLVNDLPKPERAQAQSPFVVPAGFSTVMQNYTTEQGLALDVISCSFADSKGNLWFGTFVGGVSKYDGKSFTSYSKSQGLQSNDVHGITEDHDGIIWFATSDGICTFDGSMFAIVAEFKGVNGIYCDNEGTIWFGTARDGLGRYKDHKLTLFSSSEGLSESNIYSPRVAKDGKLWFGTEHGLYTFDGKVFTSVHSNAPFTNQRVISVCIDKNGDIWGSCFASFIKYDGTTFTNYPFSNLSSFSGQIHEDRLGNLWITNSGEGVVLYDGVTFKVITRNQGLLNNHVVSICEDKSGNLWFSTDAGISKYSGTAFTNYTQAQGIGDNSIRSITEAENGELWFAGNSLGVSKYDGKNFYNYRKSHGLPEELFWCIKRVRSGDIWIGTVGDGAVKFDGMSFTSYNVVEGLRKSGVMCIVEDEKNRLWFGSENGVIIFDGKSYTNITTKQGLPDNRVWTIHEDKSGIFWFGTEKGLCRYDGKTTTSYSKAQGLVDDHIKSILEDKHGNLWIGTYGGGISRFDGHSFATFTLDNGLPDNVVTQVASTQDGEIVFGTNYGIGVLTGFTLDYKTDAFSNSQSKLTLQSLCPAQNSLTNKQLSRYSPTIEIYNTKTGFPVKDVNRGQNAIFLDSKGILWIATGSEKSGLVRLNYSGIKRVADAPSVHLMSLRVSNEKVSWYDLLSRKKGIDSLAHPTNSLITPPSVTEEITTFGQALTDDQRALMIEKFKDVQFDSVSKDYPVPQNLILPFKHNHIAIEFAAIEPSRPTMVQYRCKLEGYDKEWSALSNATSVTYGNIDAGTYTFFLKAQGPNGIWCEPISYSFEVLPPWYTTWWAYSVYAVALLTAAGGISRWRERKLRKEKAKLERMVEHRTEEVVAEKSEAERQRQRSDELLLNILPSEVAEELKSKGSASAKHYDYVTVMFTDFKNFTKISEHLSPTELVAEIDTCYKAFDSIITKHNIEKIKTIGDSYMCAGGLPVANNTNAIDVVNAALEIQQFMREHMKQREIDGKVVFENRIGIHTGPVVAGIVGVKKFAYDIWGDTVNIASRMESSGEAGEVNISGSTYELVKDQFTCTYRGKIEAKNKGEIDMYFVRVR